MAFTPGQQLQNGKYVIDQSLNQGRFGISYLAHDKRNQRLVIKTFQDDTWQNLTVEEKDKINNRWLREGGVLSRFNDPHIVQFYEPFLEQGQVCLVMEYIDGQDLASLSSQILPVEKALEYIQQIGSALQVIHAQGLVHRDVKPGNIMLRAGKPEAILIDFGLAGGTDETITMNKSTTEENFTAPELIDSNGKTEPYSDVYSLGATLYALLSGQAPPPVKERVKIGKDKLPPLPETVDQQIYDAITEAMKLDYTQRLKTVDEFLNLLNFSGSKKRGINPPIQQQGHDPDHWTRIQTRFTIYSVGVGVLGILVAILLTLFGQELKNFLMSPFSQPSPEKQQERKSN